jgi:hypothetical protein
MASSENHFSIFTGLRAAAFFTRLPAFEVAVDGLVATGDDFLPFTQALDDLRIVVVADPRLTGSTLTRSPSSPNTTSMGRAASGLRVILVQRIGGGGGRMGTAVGEGEMDVRPALGQTSGHAPEGDAQNIRQRDRVLDRGVHGHARAEGFLLEDPNLSPQSASLPADWPPPRLRRAAGRSRFFDELAISVTVPENLRSRKADLQPGALPVGDEDHVNLADVHARLHLVEVGESA